ncbi:TIR domain-containing protein [Prevotella herbatica]|uniref:TIR domain-containing protein n=1 Tax=Prevotella herbatica TaxID=2801997 RepID=A0ABN6EGJ6_9BACT|nr:TIR domain-containing protein [Prevotella herbatica]BCS85030.1 TIR domain-containing protein [Prevotella herbatica]
MKKRQVFYSFHFKNDSWRAGQVRNIGAIEGNAPVSSNDWEEVKRKGEYAIKKWIHDNMNYRSCIIVLIGEETSNRPWCRYEIEKAWKEGKGIVGIYIHGLKNALSQQSLKGENPFRLFYIDITFNYIAQKSSASDSNEINLGKVCKTYDAPFLSSEYVYSYIKQNIEDWVEEAIRIRNQYPK